MSQSQVSHVAGASRSHVTHTQDFRIYGAKLHESRDTSSRKSWLRHVERWGAGVETQKNVRGEIGGWGRVPFNEPYAPSLSTIYDGA